MNTHQYSSLLELDGLSNQYEEIKKAQVVQSKGRRDLPITSLVQHQLAAVVQKHQRQRQHQRQHQDQYTVQHQHQHRKYCLYEIILNHHQVAPPKETHQPYNAQQV